ncbi:MAG: glycosyltransferase family 2 protein [Methylocella sp.]
MVLLLRNVTAKDVAIIVLNYAGWRDTILCVESLLLLDYAAFRIVLCDNASPDDSVARLQNWAKDRLPFLNEELSRNGKRKFGFSTAPKGLPGPARPPDEAQEVRDIVLIETGQNFGYAGGNNVGIRYALQDGECKYVWILNNDTSVRPDSLAWLVQRMEEDGSIGVCGSVLCYMDRPDVVQYLAGSSFSKWKGRATPLGFRSRFADPVDISDIERRLDFVVGACAFVSRRCIEAVGLMAEDLFLYGEELEWAQRIRKKFRLGFAPNSIVYHKVGASIGTKDVGTGSELSQFYLTRNRVRLCARFAKRGLPFVFADIGRGMFRCLLAGQFRHAIVALRAILGLPFRPSE